MRGAVRTLAVVALWVLAVYAYGAVDGLVGYRRRSREPAIQPFVAASPDSGALGISVQF